MSAATTPLTRKGLSLRWKLIIGSVVVEVVMLTLLVFNSVRLIETSLTEQAELRLKEVSVLLNSSIAPSLAAQDYGPILDTFNSSRNEHGISYLALWDNRGRQVALSGWPAAQPLPVAGGKLTGNHQLERFDTRIPITLNNQTYGELQFGISTQFLQKARSKLTEQSLLIAAIEVVLSIILLTLLGLWLTRHLKTLEQAAESMAAGDYSVRLAVNSNDEISTLSRTFNVMAKEIADRLQALSESEDRFRGLSNISSDWYWEQDANYRFTHFAGGAFRQFPELAKTLVGIRRWESKNIVLSPEAMAAHQATVEAHQPFRDFEYKAINASGEFSYLSVNGEPVFNQDGSFNGYRGTGKDITVRKASEAAVRESEEKFAGLFQLSPLPLALVDWRTRLIDGQNDAWAQLFGTQSSEDSAENASFSHLFNNDSERAAFTRLIDQRGRCEQVEAHLMAKGEQTLNCELSARTLEIRTRRYLLCCVRDVTQQRLAEAQIIELNSRLEQRVSERTRELQQALETLQRAQNDLINSEKLAALGRVVAAVAHELNTPIGNSVMVATTLEEKSKEFSALAESGSIRRTQINDFVRDSLAGSDMLVRNLQQAHHLIHSFKQVAVDQTSDRQRQFDLKVTLDEIVATMTPMLRKTPHSLTLEVAGGIVMHSYPGPLGQILNNLVNNALLHAFPEGSEGQMRLSASLTDTGHVELQFADNGQGMDKEHLKQIFDPFFTTRLGQGGSGLGLNIVYNLATRILGGSIEVNSTLGQGTAFTLLLPLVAAEQKTDTDLLG